MAPGDVLVSHPGALHGGAAVEDAMKEGDLFRHPGFLQLR